jgi:histidinol-phosphate phosphatase family protein
MTRAVFLDRDGTVNEEVGYLGRPEGLRLLPGVTAALAALQAAGWQLIIVSNQSGVGRGLFPQAAVEAVDARLRELLAAAGVRLTASYYCPHAPWESCLCRKPAPGLLLRAAADLGIDLPRSYMVGDAPRDVAAGRAAGCRTILLGAAADAAADVVLPDLPTAAAWILHHDAD